MYLNSTVQNTCERQAILPPEQSELTQKDAEEGQKRKKLIVLQITLLLSR